MLEIPSTDCFELRTKLCHFIHDDLVRILPAVLIEALETRSDMFVDSIIRFLCGRNLPLLCRPTLLPQAQKELNDFVHYIRAKEDPFAQFTSEQACAIDAWLNLAKLWDQVVLDKAELAAASDYWAGRCQFK